MFEAVHSRFFHQLVNEPFKLKFNLHLMGESVIKRWFVHFSLQISPKKNHRGCNIGGGDSEPTRCHVTDEDYLSKINALLHHPSTDEEGILKIAHTN